RRSVCRRHVKHTLICRLAWHTCTYCPESRRQSSVAAAVDFRCVNRRIGNLAPPFCQRSTLPCMSQAEKVADSALPSPADRPDADVVIYDGECSICTGQIKKLVWWDCQNKLSYLSLHDSEVQRRWPDMSYDRLMQEMAVVACDGHRYWGPEAIR